MKNTIKDIKKRSALSGTMPQKLLEAANGRKVKAKVKTKVPTSTKAKAKVARAATDSRSAKSGVIISASDFDAVLFDMDGVVTRTAQLHMRAWTKTFNAFLKGRDGDKFKPFSRKDYLDYVDGRPREDGVRSFLQSRKIEAEEKIVHTLATKKDREFMHIVHTEGVEPYETTVALIRSLRAAGISIALVTASCNGEEILKVAKLTSLFDAIVTGVDAKKFKLRGKPAPDVFLEAARRVSVKANRAIVVEDAEAGVQSGRAGRFKMVIGVAREKNKAALKKHGASVVVSDLGEVSVADDDGSHQVGFAMSDLGVTEANWVVSYQNYAPDSEKSRESLCTIGNGKFFTRGALFDAQADDKHSPGTYVAGGYNSIWVEGDANGDNDEKFEREELVNLPNWLCLDLTICNKNGAAERTEGSCVDVNEIISFRQRLNLREGVLYRDITIRDSQKRETRIKERRFVHMRYSHLCGIELQITPLNWSGKAVVRTAIDGSVNNVGDSIAPEFKSERHLSTVETSAEGELLYLKVQTSATKLVVAQAARTQICVEGKMLSPPREAVIDKADYVAQNIKLDFKTNQTVSVQKIVALFTSRDKGVYEPGENSRQYALEAEDFEALIEAQTKAWNSLWRQFDLFIETKEDFSKLVPSLLLHLNIFHTVQTASPHTVDLDSGIPARGWTGEGYQGHIFWDEIFVFPFINLHMPNITASLLKYRYRRLYEARKIAKSMGAIGACFPWQSASDGRERTPKYWWLASEKKWIRDYTHLELHINVAIAYNVWQYYQVTADLQFMYSYGSEILVEIARFLASIAKLDKKTGRYEIHGVIGPDEFHNGYPNFKTPGVNNNAYTNIMASWVFCRVINLWRDLPSDHRGQLERRLSVTAEERALWNDMSSKMFVPVMSNGVIAQFEGWDELEEFPGVGSGGIDPKQLNQLLKENQGYLNQYKVSKQADLLMLGFLFTQEELTEIIKHLGYPKSLASIEKMAQYYIPRSANQSTLSRVALRWVLSRISDESANRILQPHIPSKLKAKHSKADDQEGTKQCDAHEETQLPENTPGGIFYAALGSDYYDVASRGTTMSGIHLGAMAGTADIVQRCCTGISARDGVLWLDPQLPQQLQRIALTLRYRGQSLQISMNHDQIDIQTRHSSADPIMVGYRGRHYVLHAGASKTIAIKPRRK